LGALGIADQQLPILEVDILDSPSQRLHPPQPVAVEQTHDEPLNAIELRKD
jgi:hypothetical protein